MHYRTVWRQMIQQNHHWCIAYLISLFLIHLLSLIDSLNHENQFNWLPSGISHF